MIRPGEGSPVVTFVAARGGEGTSTIALEFARAARGIGKASVLLLDATLRIRFSRDMRHTVAEVMDAGLPLDLAVAHCQEDVDRACLRRFGADDPGVDRARVVGEIWPVLREQYDMIVVDAPSLEETAFGLLLAGISDAVIVVVRAEHTRRPAVRRLIDLLRQSGAPLAGTVLNRRRYYLPRFIYDRL